VNESVTVETLGSISPNDAAALARLLGQLSTTATFDKGRLHTIISHEATELLVARVGGEIVGMATFVSSTDQVARWLVSLETLLGETEQELGDAFDEIDLALADESRYQNGIYTYRTAQRLRGQNSILTNFNSPPENH
jgi:hypothetical protein